MRKIIRLKEADLVKLVKKVIREEEDFSSLFYPNRSGEDNDKVVDDYFSKNPRPSAPPKPKGKGPFATHKSPNFDWYDSDDRAVQEPTDYSEEREFGPDEYDDFMEFINDCDTKWCLKTKQMYDRYAQQGNIVVRK